MKICPPSTKIKIWGGYYILEFRSCPERYNYLCISKESSEEHPADVFSDIGVEDDDTDLKH